MSWTMSSSSTDSNGAFLARYGGAPLAGSAYSVDSAPMLPARLVGLSSASRQSTIEAAQLGHMPGRLPMSVADPALMLSFDASSARPKSGASLSDGAGRRSQK